MSKLAGKVAVVTGASKGIGAGIAKSLARDGASVVVNYSSDKSGADKTVAEIEAAGGKAIAVQGSVAKSADVTRLFTEALKTYQRVDILVNNAGVYAFGPLSAFTEDEYRRQFDTNVLGLLLASQAAASAFGDKGGSIINIGSVASHVNGAGTSIYAATKASVDTITQVLSRELGPLKIRVNSVNPGPVNTEGFASMGIKMDDPFVVGMLAQTPLGRIGEASDIGDAVALLVSDEARWITGQVIRVSGGLQ
ncbi:SDR family NAD(P)-dependent oxidoreductase [Granulicella paludicola]|uniref:SDR family NAD(P)-dependent oxidoreductase n=1 Tax=Granulicella paludicola TaxID=474951 RepID=UPI0021E03BE5|nr:glucose 1-dehydrogenase [Granulicella paludicola]